MINKIKEAIEMVLVLEKEHGLKVEKALESIKDIGVIGLNGYNVQFFEAEDLKEFADGRELSVEIRDDSTYPYELIFADGGMEFFVILTEEEYQSYLKPEDEALETEHAQASLTSYERKMKEFGLKESDFA